MEKLTREFATHFSRAIDIEMQALEQQLGTSEIEIRYGSKIDGSWGDNAYRYSFDLIKPNERLVQGIECTLRHCERQYQVLLDDVSKNSVVLSVKAALDPSIDSSMLTIYPWFLYERLKQKLEAMPGREDLNCALALALFGKIKVSATPAESLKTSNSELNESQQRAVQLCIDSPIAFVWGPPGTGKTMTLGHIVAELYAQGKRLLICSTTNAAVDQALARMARIVAIETCLSEGLVVRIGQTDAPTFGAHLSEIRNRRSESNLNIAKDLAHANCYRRILEQIDRVLESLRQQETIRQLDMFKLTSAPAVDVVELAKIFPYSRAQQLALREIPGLMSVLKLRAARLLKMAVAADLRSASNSGNSHASADTIISNAKIVLSTMAGVWAGAYLEHQRFDIVIIEEAGMALLPAVFYCASLAREKVIIVGDPRQLPPIVLSNDRYVRRAIGRSIFEVAFPDPGKSDLVAMLDFQYRMHPSIAGVVSRMFYNSRLKNGDLGDDCLLIQYKRPVQGRPLIILDTGGKTVCEMAKQSHSRMNRITAAVAVQLAEEAHGDGMATIAIITPYAEQSRLIKSIAREKKIDSWLECSTVHRFQGHEKDCIIFDTVDTEPLLPSVLLQEKKTFSSTRNLLNVSISRARGKLVILADVSYFKRHAAGGIIDELLDTAARYGSHIGLWEIAGQWRENPVS